MPEIITAEAQPYIYVEKESEFGSAMEPHFIDGFGKLGGFLQKHGATPVGPPMSVTMTVDGNRSRFRVSHPVTAEVADRAESDSVVNSDVLKGGKTVHVTHTGSYEGLSQTYDDLMTWMQKEGLGAGMPCWEVYVDDPGEVPEQKLRTEIFIPVA